MNPAARRRAPRSRLCGPVAAALLVALTVGGCSGSEPTPAEARRARVETRLRTSFSGAQTRCILERADEDLLRALDRTRDLGPDALGTWSDVLVACVTDPDGTTTTR